MTATCMTGSAGSFVFSRQPDAPRPVTADYIEFAVLGSTPRWSREFTVRFLRQTRGISDDVTDTALHIVSELVTNAIQAARKLNHRSTVGLSLRLFGDHLLIEVVDSSPEIPALAGTADVFSEHGRGLYLVDSLTDSRWGWFRWPGMPRKVVWARLMV
jgi:anti-sigma regulatory factor (Ser/Thr protein kinase)